MLKKNNYDAMLLQKKTKSNADYLNDLWYARSCAERKCSQTSAADDHGIRSVLRFLCVVGLGRIVYEMKRSEHVGLLPFREWYQHRIAEVWPVT